MLRHAEFILCCAVVPFICLSSASQKPSATLQIKLPLSEFEAGTPIRLDVIVRNSTSEDFHVWKASPEVDGQAEAYVLPKVLDAHGKSLSRIDGITVVRNGKKYSIGRQWLKRRGAILKPAEELHDFLILSNLFDLTKPGTYVVSAVGEITRPDPGPEIKWIAAQSNEITFIVK